MLFITTLVVNANEILMNGNFAVLPTENYLEMPGYRPTGNAKAAIIPTDFRISP